MDFQLWQEQTLVVVFVGHKGLLELLVIRMIMSFLCKKILISLSFVLFEQTNSITTNVDNCLL